MGIDDGLNAQVESLAMGKKLVEFDLTENSTEGRLRELRGLVDVVRDFDDDFDGIDDAKGENGVDFEGDVVAGDDVLRRHLHGFLSEGDTDDLIDRPEDKDDAGTLGVLPDTTETEDNDALVLLDD